MQSYFRLMLHFTIGRNRATLSLEDPSGFHVAPIKKGLFNSRADSSASREPRRASSRASKTSSFESIMSANSTRLINSHDRYRVIARADAFDLVAAFEFVPSSLRHLPSREHRLKNTSCKAILLRDRAIKVAPPFSAVQPLGVASFVRGGAAFLRGRTRGCPVRIPPPLYLCLCLFLSLSLSVRGPTKATNIYIRKSSGSAAA